MSLEVVTDQATEPLRDEVSTAVESALGRRIDHGSWKVELRKLPSLPGLIVDLTNGDGIMRQWLFADPSEPVASVIHDDLQQILR
jgi:hypothetical protein